MEDMIEIKSASERKALGLGSVKANAFRKKSQAGESLAWILVGMVGFVFAVMVGFTFVG